VHHLTPFSQGDLTNLDDMVLLCRSHHTQVHRDLWSIQLTAINSARQMSFINTRTGHRILQT
jgi:hypothetical protein